MVLNFSKRFRHKDLNNVYHTIIMEEFECDVFLPIDYNPDFEYSYPENDINRLNNQKCTLLFTKYKIPILSENKYLLLLEDVLKNGKTRNTRNGKTISLFDKNISFNVSDNFPLLTTKKMFLKGIIEELLFFIRGDTDTNILRDKGIRIWDGNTSREFLDKMGLEYDVGDMGPMYGYQWNFLIKYNEKTGGIDQLKI